MRARAGRLFGVGEIEALFPDEAPLTVVPWDQAGKRRDRETYNRNLVAKLLTGPPLAVSFADLDPAELRATQPSHTRSGVDYYLRDGYRRHGRTYADQFKAGNKFPNRVPARRGQPDLVRSPPRGCRVVAGEAPPVADHRRPLGAGGGRASARSRSNGPSCGQRNAANATVFLTPSLLIGADAVAHLRHTVVHQTRDALVVIYRAGKHRPAAVRRRERPRPRRDHPARRGHSRLGRAPTALRRHGTHPARRVSGHEPRAPRRTLVRVSGRPRRRRRS